MATWLTALIPSVAVALGLTPLLAKLAMRMGAVDRPGRRSMHDHTVPYLGGVAIFGAFAAGSGLMLLYARHSHGWLASALTSEAAARNINLGAMVGGLLLGGLLVLILGTADDTAPLWASRLPWLCDVERRGLRPLVKVVIEVGAAVILLRHGFVIQFVLNPLHPSTYIYFPAPVAAVLTLLWVVAITNAVNLIDGLDGLAAGTSSIAAATLLVIATIQGDMWLAALGAAALLGGCLGFLPWNFHPARIFMGDGGALFLGFALAGLSVVGPLKSPTVVALAVPALAMGLPVLDTVLAVVRRWRGGQGVAVADRAHVHHRLIAMGLSHRDCVLVLYAVSGWLGISALAIDRVAPLLGLCILAFVVLSLALIARVAGLASPPAPAVQRDLGA